MSFRNCFVTSVTLVIILILFHLRIYSFVHVTVASKDDASNLSSTCAKVSNKNSIIKFPN